MLQLSPEGDTEEHSQAYYIIQAAQQKEELLREKEALLAEITKAEREIQALSNSLTSLNAQNQKLHMFKTRGGMTAEDLELSNNIKQVFKNIPHC